MLIPKIGDVAMVVMSAITQQGSTVELKGNNNEQAKQYSNVEMQPAMQMGTLPQKEG